MKPPRATRSNGPVQFDFYEEILWMLLPMFAICAGAIGALAACIYPAMWVMVAMQNARMRSDLIDVGLGLTRLPANASNPAAAFPKDAARLPGAAVMYPVLLLAVAIVACLVFFAISAWMRRGLAKSKKGSQWGTKRTLQSIVGPLDRLRGARGRVILGRLTRNSYLATKGFTSVIVFGPPGSGKTTGFAEPAVVEHHGPALVASMKMDLARNTIAVRDALVDGRALVYDPSRSTNLNDRFRCGWTPLARCRTWAGTKRMASWLCSVSSSAVGGAEDDFWKKNAAMMLEPALFLMANSPGKTMADVVEWVQNKTSTLQTAWDTLAIEVEYDGPESAQFKRNMKLANQQLDGVFEWDEKSVSGARTTAMNVLKAYTDPDLVDVSAANSVNLDRFLDGPNTIYICAPATEQEFLRPVLAAMVKDVITTSFERANAQGGELEQPLLIVLDEVANIAPIADLDVIATTCRSHAISLVTLTQSYSQLVDRWSVARAKSIFEGHGAKVLLRGSTDTDLLKSFRSLLGEREERRTTRSRNQSGTSEGEQIRDRSIAMEDELRSLDEGTALILYGGNEPTKVDLRPFFEDPTFRHYREINDNTADVLNAPRTQEYAV